MCRLLVPLGLAIVGAVSGALTAKAEGQIQIYRCQDAHGGVAFRDSPCPSGESEEIREYQAPRDPPPSRTALRQEPAPPLPSPETEVRVVVLRPPQPLYECTTYDGEVYTSDTPEGNPRWVPLWVLDYRPIPGFGRPVGSRPGFLPPSQGGAPPSGPPPGPPPGHGHSHPGIIGSGTWIKDECRRLPQRDVCTRLAQRRREVLSRYGVAMPSERRELRQEKDAIDERLANDCRDY